MHIPCLQIQPFGCLSFYQRNVHQHAVRCKCYIFCILCSPEQPSRLESRLPSQHSRVQMSNALQLTLVVTLASAQSVKAQHIYFSTKCLHFLQSLNGIFSTVIISLEVSRLFLKAYDNKEKTCITLINHSCTYYHTNISLIYFTCQFPHMYSRWILHNFLYFTSLMLQDMLCVCGRL